MGEKCLVKGTFPHVTPFVLRRPLTRPLQRPFRRSLRPAGPASIRFVMMSARTSASPAPLPVAPLVGSSVGQRLVHRSAAAPPQATLGSGGNHPHLPLRVPDPIHLLLGPLPDTGSDSDVPGPPVQSSAGVTHTTPSATHPVHLWLAGQTSASGVGVVGVAGMARLRCCWPDGTASRPLPRPAVAGSHSPNRPSD